MSLGPEVLHDALAAAPGGVVEPQPGDEDALERRELQGFVRLQLLLHLRENEGFEAF